MSDLARTVARLVAGLLLVPVAMAAVSLPVALVAGEARGAAGFGATAGAGLLLAGVLHVLARGARPGHMHHAALATASGWLLIALVAAIPFLAWTIDGGAPPDGAGAFEDPVDAFFEAFSGITGTGLTVVPDPARLPVSLQWWRSLSEWVGGLGVVVAVSVVFRHGAEAYRLYRAEARDEKIAPSVRSTVRAMGAIYLVMTGLAIGGLLACGRPAWEAVNHGLTSISTGGFTITSDSAGSYGLPARVVLIAAMIAGAIGFHAHHAVFVRRRPRKALREVEHRLLLGLLVAGGGTFALVVGAGPAGWSDPVFQWTSALTTAGLSTADPGRLGTAGMFLLAVAMTIGGEAGATVGGIKLARVAMLGRGLAWLLRDVRRTPHEVSRFRVDGTALAPGEAYRLLRSAALLAIAWITLLALSTFVLALAVPERPLEDVLFEAASAQGNVGLSVGIVGTGLSDPATIWLCVVMWLGRLEIIPVLVLVATIAGRGAAVPDFGERR